MSVIALILLGFGVLNKNQQTVINMHNFLRKQLNLQDNIYKETEIVIVEDNCPIHSTKKVKSS